MKTEALPVPDTALDPTPFGPLTDAEWSGVNAAFHSGGLTASAVALRAVLAERSALCDADRFGTEDVDPDDAPAFEPSEDDRRYWAEHAPEPDLGDLNREDVDPLWNALPFPAPICGGSPAADRAINVRVWDDRPGVRSRHTKGQPNLTDEDVIIATGCCG